MHPLTNDYISELALIEISKMQRMKIHMSQGKYSPNLPNSHKGYDFFDRNAKGEIPQIPDSLAEYDEEYHFASYDPEGFDVYGYSAYDRNGEFVGGGRGVDRNGYTEMDYLNMSAKEYEEFF